MERHLSGLLPVKRMLLGLAIIAIAAFESYGGEFRIARGDRVKIECGAAPEPVIRSAIKLFCRDMGKVLDADSEMVSSGGDIVVGLSADLRCRFHEAVSMLDSIDGKWEAFGIKVLGDGTLLVAGSDSHGAAYGVMELSRRMGVSPWEWWADSEPVSLKEFSLPSGYCEFQSPDVAYRGIFINDEDWGLMPWSGNNYEPECGLGKIGPKTCSRIFELMLRLRANTFWPAMHECTMPFFQTDGNREVARKYGIYIGGSHCEPMACNAAGEWSRRGKGEYDYVNNGAEVYRFWEDRVKEVADQEIFYTLGMRGVHDGAMKGAKSVKARKKVIERVFIDQRNLLKRYVNDDVTKVPQVFIPYKEVLDIYNAGLEVPDDVTLMWCDDNYGYVKHFPTESERARKGGNGIYYHVSYWGRPHDYLWLGTFSPYLLFHQMHSAYNRGIDRIWILNVGDIKPAEYQIELFMDMAWNIDKVVADGVEKHLEGFLMREFGDDTGRELLPAMNEHYRLAFIKKPEFMANTRVEEKNREYYSTIRCNKWSVDSLLKRRDEYVAISNKVEAISEAVSTDKADCYFQLVKYPVQAAAQMNLKFIDAQLSSYGLSPKSRSDEAYDSIVALTAIYNNGIHNEGKWNGLMDMAPRKLPVFGKASCEMAVDSEHEAVAPVARFDGLDGKGDFVACHNLGYNGGAVDVDKDVALDFDIPAIGGSDSITIDVRLLPTHPVDDGGLSFTLAIDGQAVAENVDYATRGRSEEWKLNVLENQAIRKFRVKNDGRPHTLTFIPSTSGVTLDRILIWNR
ncbi:MAG: glycosyl hydrolase 115 family protein [Bacteroides sp.]|nr:glycosyl hydrolase 115 family protein [Bacteroides sp.]MCM1389591.1 glycosyl hydrolase 115 family protein [Bacteroides sp.]